MIIIIITFTLEDKRKYEKMKGKHFDVDFLI